MIYPVSVNRQILSLNHSEMEEENLRMRQLVRKQKDTFKTIIREISPKIQ